MSTYATKDNASAMEESEYMTKVKDLEEENAQLLQEIFLLESQLMTTQPHRFKDLSGHNVTVKSTPRMQANMKNYSIKLKRKFYEFTGVSFKYFTDDTVTAFLYPSHDEQTADVQPYWVKISRVTGVGVVMSYKLPYITSMKRMMERFPITSDKGLFRFVNHIQLCLESYFEKRQQVYILEEAVNTRYIKISTDLLCMLVQIQVLARMSQPEVKLSIWYNEDISIPYRYIVRVSEENGTLYKELNESLASLYKKPLAEAFLEAVSNSLLVNSFTSDEDSEAVDDTSKLKREQLVVGVDVTGTVGMRGGENRHKRRKKVEDHDKSGSSSDSSEPRPSPKHRKLTTKEPSDSGSGVGEDPGRLTPKYKERAKTKLKVANKASPLPLPKRTELWDSDAGTSSGESQCSHQRNMDIFDSDSDFDFLRTPSHIKNKNYHGKIAKRNRNKNIKGRKDKLQKIKDASSKQLERQSENKPSNKIIQNKATEKRDVVQTNKSSKGTIMHYLKTSLGNIATEKSHEQGLPKKSTQSSTERILQRKDRKRVASLAGSASQTSPKTVDIPKHETIRVNPIFYQNDFSDGESKESIHSAATIKYVCHINDIDMNSPNYLNSGNDEGSLVNVEADLNQNTLISHRKADKEIHSSVPINVVRKLFKDRAIESNSSGEKVPAVTDEKNCDVTPKSMNDTGSLNTSKHGEKTKTAKSSKASTTRHITNRNSTSDAEYITQLENKVTKQIPKDQILSPPSQDSRKMKLVNEGKQSPLRSSPRKVMVGTNTLILDKSPNIRNTAWSHNDSQEQNLSQLTVNSERYSVQKVKSRINTIHTGQTKEHISSKSERKSKNFSNKDNISSPVHQDDLLHKSQSNERDQTVGRGVKQVSEINQTRTKKAKLEIHTSNTSKMDENLNKKNSSRKIMGNNSLEEQDSYLSRSERSRTRVGCWWQRV